MPTDAETKTCPQCISDVPAEAQVCRHCQYVWPDSPLGQQRQRRRAHTREIVVAVICAALTAAAVWMMYQADREDGGGPSDCEIDEVVLNEDLDC